jgi:plasmid stability protein
MAQVLVRDLDRAVVEKLKARAADHGRSLQAELKAILEAQARQVTKGRLHTDSGELQAEDRER